MLLSISKSKPRNSLINKAYNEKKNVNKYETEYFWPSLVEMNPHWSRTWTSSSTEASGFRPKSSQDWRKGRQEPETTLLHHWMNSSCRNQTCALHQLHEPFASRSSKRSECLRLRKCWFLRRSRSRPKLRWARRGWAWAWRRRTCPLPPASLQQGGTS